MAQLSFPLQIAAELGLTETLRALIKGCGDSSNEIPPGVASSIHSAAAAGHSAVIKTLLDAGRTQIDTLDESTGHTPLMAATDAGHVGVINLLLDAGADAAAHGPPASAAAGESALTLASKACHHAALAALLSKGASPNACDGRGISLLMLCAAYRPSGPKGEFSVASCIHLLLKEPGGASITAVDQDGATALAHAAAAGNHSAAAALLYSSADLTPLHISHPATHLLLNSHATPLPPCGAERPVAA